MKYVVVFALVSYFVGLIAAQEPPVTVSDGSTPAKGPKGGKHNALVRDLCAGNITAEDTKALENVLKMNTCVREETTKLDTYKTWKACVDKATADRNARSQVKTVEDLKSRCVPKSFQTDIKACGRARTPEQGKELRAKCKKAIPGN